MRFCSIWAPTPETGEEKSRMTGEIPLPLYKTLSPTAKLAKQLLATFVQRPMDWPPAVTVASSPFVEVTFSRVPKEVIVPDPNCAQSMKSFPPKEERLVNVSIVSACAKLQNKNNMVIPITSFFIIPNERPPWLDTAGGTVGSECSLLVHFVEVNL